MKEETPPELSIAERIGEAARQVNKADQHATTIAKQLYDLECQDSLSLAILARSQGAAPLAERLTDLAQRVRALVIERSLALQSFTPCEFKAG